ncbi:MAG: carboxypeptidase-like regulatory domain-containing protein [Acidobacteriota bacterium]|nr:carboxypeptidase-like regulatory domain-containing protein [Acidobacteriota bacterium]
MKNSRSVLVITRWLLLTTTIVFLCPASVLAQSGAGGMIQGTVKDPTDAVIPGAIVKITDLATGRVTNSVTNSEGFFVSPPLTIGNYKVRVEAANMKAWEGELQVETARTAEINAVL